MFFAKRSFLTHWGTLFKYLFQKSEVLVINTAIQSENFKKVQQLLQKTLYSDLSEAHKKQATLLFMAVEASQAKMFSEWRYAHYKLIMLIAEYAYQGSQQMDKPDPEVQQIALDLYWHYRIIVARAEGKLPAWEGIRLVRERR